MENNKTMEITRSELIGDCPIENQILFEVMTDLKIRMTESVTTCEHNYNHLREVMQRNQTFCPFLFHDLTNWLRKLGGHCDCDIIEKVLTIPEVDRKIRRGAGEEFTVIKN